MFKKAVTKGMFKRMVSMLMAFVMVIGMVPEAAIKVKAEEAWEKNVVCLGTSAIKKPVAGEKDKQWTGSFVWYGKYDAKPVKYRVLSPYTTSFGCDSMLLDCDSVLYMDTFITGKKSYINTSGKGCGHEWMQNKWDFGFATIREKLNGERFLDKYGVFTDNEKKAIATSWFDHGYCDYNTSRTDERYTDKVFFLEAVDVRNDTYGYIAYNELYDEEYNEIACRNKKDLNGVDSPWWLRTPNSSVDGLDDIYECVKVDIVYSSEYSKGYIHHDWVDSSNGVSPAFNVSLNRVLFSSLVSGEVGKDNAEYKLTLTTSDFSVNPADVTAEDRTVSVPYSLVGENKGNINQISLLILDKEYSAKAANKEKTNILYYDKLASDAYIKKTGIGTVSFELPAELNKGKWGKEYFVYLVAEQINDQYETDYACTPASIDKPDTFQMEEEHSITISDDGNGTASASASKCYEGVEVTLTSTPKSGYHFKEWQVVSGGITIADNKFKMGKSDVEIKAIFEADTISCNGISVSKNLTLRTGESVSMNVTFDPGNTSDRTLSWKSDNDAVVKVDETGKVTGVGCGYANVIATTKDGGFTAQCEVMVTPESIDDNDARTGISPDDLKTYVIPKKQDKTVAAKEINLGSKKEPKKVDVSISMNCYNAVTYTGKAATPKNDPDGFRFTADLSGVLLAAGISNAKSEDLLSVSFVGKSKNAGSGEFYAKISLLPKSKRKAEITSQQQKALKKLISAVNKELKKSDNRIKFTINKASILTLEPIEVHAKLDKDGKIKYDGEALKGVKSVKGKLKAADTKAKKIAKSNYKLTVVKAETNSVKVSGAGKNYTGWTTVTATK